MAHKHRNSIAEKIHMAREREDMGLSRDEGDYVKREKDGGDEVETVKRTLRTEWLLFFYFHNRVKKTQRSCPVLRRESCPLMLGQPSIMLMRVLSGPVCPPWGLIL